MTHDAHVYETRAGWTGKRQGLLESAGLPAVRVSAPPEFEGQPGLWTPEHLLVASVESCFMTTFLAIAEMSQLPLGSYQSTAQTSLERPEGKGYAFREIVVRPVIEIARARDRERVARVIEKAERHCFVTQALRIPVRVEAVITVGEEAEITQAA